MLFMNMPNKSEAITVENVSQSQQNEALILNKVNERMEIQTKRTPNSKTYVNLDGTYTTEISQTPIHYQDFNGKWNEIDNDLISNSDDKVYRNKSNSLKVNFNKQQKTGESLIEVNEGNKSLKMQLQPLEHTKQLPSNVEGTMKGNQIRYNEVFPNIDVQYEVGSDRIKENIVYKKKPTDGFPKKFSYKMDLEGMYVKELNGVIQLLDKETNEPLYYFDAPYMYDSYVPTGFQSVEGLTAIPEEAISYDVKLDFETVDNQLFLHLYPNIEWLTNENRVYPIVIDPTIVKLQSSPYVEDTNIRSGFPTQTGGNDVELGAGTTSGNTIRSLLKFDLSSILLGSEILDSNLDLWFSSTNGNTSINVGLHKVTKDWIENQSSWNYAKTVPSTTWTTSGGDFESTPLSTVTGLTSPGTLDSSMKKWNIPTSVIQGWLSNPSSNYGFLLKSTTEGTNYYKKFISSENTLDSKYHPLLVVTYKSISRLGLEDYWKFESQPLVGGTSYANLTTGNNIIQYEDIILPNKGGFSLPFIRTHNSKSVEKSLMGLGWTYTGNEKLFINGNTIIYQEEDGTDHSFVFNSTTGLFDSGPGKYLTIKQNAIDSTIYELEDKFGMKTIFKVTDSSSEYNGKIATIQSKIDRHNNQILFEYTNNRLNQIKSDFGGGIVRTIQFTYNTSEYVDKITDGSNQYTYRYDVNGRMSSVEYRNLNTGEIQITNFEYDVNNRIKAIVNPYGRRTDYTYQNEMLVKVQPPDANAEIDTTTRLGTTIEIDTINKYAKITDLEGSITEYYSNSNYVATEIIEDGVATTYQLDSNYNRLTINEETNGIVTNQAFDSKGNVLTVTDSSSSENNKTYTYITFSNVKTEKDDQNQTTTYNYKTNGDLDYVLHPDNTRDTYVFDSYGDLTSVNYRDGSSETRSIDYSTFKTTVTKKDVNSNSTTVVTDINGNEIEKIDGKGNKTYFQYNAKNELIKVMDAKYYPLKSTDYGYDINGNLESITNAKGIRTSLLGYDENNNRIFEENALSKRTEFKYDANNNLIETKLSNIHYIVNEFDVVENQLMNIKIKNNINDIGTIVWGLDYNEKGQLTRICKVSPCDNDTKAQKRFVYDSTDDSLDYFIDRGNKIDILYEKDRIFPSGLDPTLNLESLRGLQYTIGGTTYTQDYFFNDDNQLGEIKRNGVSVATINYTQDKQLDKVTYKNGGSMDYNYVNGRLNQFVIKNNANNVWDTYTYTYDANNNITGISSNAGQTSYTYDSNLNQLIKEQLPNGNIFDYTYDEVGNRTSKKISFYENSETINYVYNNANQLIQVGAQMYQYDDLGNLISDGNRTYIYNDFKQLTEIKDSNNQTIANYTYDEDGKRISSTTSSGTLNYFYVGDKVVYETDGMNNIKREYTYRDDGLPLTMTMNTYTYYYLYNQHGDIIGLTDSVGNVVASYTYDAWGNIVAQSGPMASVNPYRYAGYRYDENTKLYYLLARYYNPNDGVFLTRDPILGDINDPSTQNGYNYANNNPVGLFDPNGKSAVWITAPEAADGSGHTSLLIQAKNGVWWYFWFGTFTDQNPVGYAKSNVQWQRIGTKLPALNQLHAFVNYKFQYKKSVFLKGDFSKSHKRAQEFYQKRGSRSYNVVKFNCMHASINVLFPSYDFKIQTALVAIVGYTLSPNSAHTKVAKYFRNSKYPGIITKRGETV